MFNVVKLGTLEEGGILEEGDTLIGTLEDKGALELGFILMF
jgi:hypothetical protein